MRSSGNSAIVASDIRCTESEAGARLSCRVRGPDMPASLWFEVPPELAPTLGPGGDAFLPPLLLACMLREAPLVIEADVSAALLSTAPRIMTIFGRWSSVIGREVRPVEIRAAPRPRSERGGSAGAFFSGGIDSFYTVLRNAVRYPAGDARRISHLLLVHGFDLALEDTRLFDQVRERLGKAAGELGKLLVPIRTNTRAVLTGISWDYAHGAAMAATALALGRLFHTVYVASSYEFLELAPWGSHPAVDPLWSTETLELVHDGADTLKTDKMLMLAESSTALSALRVCWKNSGGTYNCGECEKCLRTMVLLTIHGALERAATFPRAIDAAAVERLALPPYIVYRWRELRDRLAASERHRALLGAVERALERAARLSARRRFTQHTIVSALSRVGLTPGRIKAADRGLLGGFGSRLWRRLKSAGDVR